MMGNTATFTLHIRNIVQNAKDKMGWVLRVSQSRKRSLMLTLLIEVSCHSSTWVPLPALESMECKRHTCYRSHSTNVYIQNYWSTAIKQLGKTQIILPPMTTRTQYNYIYLENNKKYGAEYRWFDGAQNKNQKPSKTWNAGCYRVPNKQKSGAIPSIKCNNSVSTSRVQLTA